MSAASPALAVRDLEVCFGEKCVFTGLSFEVPAGSTVAVIGPNGAGKTALFQALIGALPSRGTVTWAPGTRLGYVPQKLDIERDLPVSGLDFLRARASVARVAAAEIERSLGLVGLPRATARQPIGSLSGGQFQRLLLAFALLARPNVLLFDEPTAGVDQPGEERLYETLYRLQQEGSLTILLISHELTLVYRYAGAVLCFGRERPCYGPPAEILTPESLAEAFGAEVGFHRHPRQTNP